MLGCGKMGQALMSCLLKADGYHIVVIDPASITLDSRVIHYPSADFLNASDTFDVALLAVKPAHVDQAIRSLRKAVRFDGAWISIAAGITVNKLEELTGSELIVRAMPNLAVEIGRGVTGFFANPVVSGKLKDRLTKMFMQSGSTLWFSCEEDLDRLTAVTGSGPGFAYEIVRHWVNAAKNLGFADELAREMVIDTLVGALFMAREKNASFEDLRDNVTSKGGTTEAGLREMADQGLDRLFDNVLGVAFKRASQLG